MSMASCHDLGNLTLAEFKERYTNLGYISGLHEDASVRKVVNNATNEVEILKTFPGAPRTPYNGVWTEIASICEFQMDPLRKYTDGIYQINEYGTKDTNVTFFTMPIYQEWLPVTEFEQLAMMFELFLTVAVLHMNGIEHNDLHPGNILFKKVPYIRRYTINGIEFSCISPMVPVIIDFEKAKVVEKHTSFNSRDIQYLVGLGQYIGAFRRMGISDGIVSMLALELGAGFSILFHPIFESLTQVEIQGGDVVKVFEPLVLPQEQP